MEPSRRHKTICLPFESEEHYRACVEETSSYRQHLEQVFHKYPELFPSDFDQGFAFHDTYRSKKQDISLRRIKIKNSGDVYGLRPSFLMPSMIERTDDVEKALYLRQWAVPFDALAYVFGKNPMFWYRASLAMGRPSIVGSTVKSADKLPTHLVADEKHTRLRGQKVFVPTTVAKGCILGASVVDSSSTDALKQGYGEFAVEAKDIDPDYSPETVCADGWQSTWDAFQRLFPTITIILCFLHSVLKVTTCYASDRWQRSEAVDKLWDIYKAATKAQFSQRVRRMRQWTMGHLPGGSLRSAVLKLCEKRDAFKVAYDFISPHRTSNGVDRLMNHQDRLLYAMRFFHGTRDSARLAVRAMAVMWNFHPYGPRLQRSDRTRRSPFVDLNGFCYHDNWLHNFLIASSMGGHRR